ncbi:hypothetical protein ACWGLF_27805 [Streptomyces puniciscabiei]
MKGLSIGAAAGAEGPPGRRRCCRVGAEYSTGSQLIEVGQADPGEDVEEIGLGRTDVLRGLGTGAKGAAGYHAIIVRATGAIKRDHGLAARRYAIFGDRRALHGTVL